MPIGVSQPPYQPLVENVRTGGRLVGFRIQQRIDYKEQRPVYFEKTTDGKSRKGFEAYAPDGTPNEPICDWVFTVDTGQADDSGDTERRIFLDPRRGTRGTAVEGLRGQDAIERAVKAAGAHRVGLELGGEIYITRGPKIAPRRGDEACVTYTAEYVPPPGGPGTGQPVDETKWLAGGVRFDPADRGPVDNPVDQGGPRANSDLESVRDILQPGSHDLAAATREATDQLARAHASSPVLNRDTRSSFDEEPPF